MKFTDLNINNPILNALSDLGFSEPTPIQVKAFAPIMAGKDVLGIAQTGTGKTLAYLIPLIRQWQFSKKKVPLLLILVPTRELVVQVVEQFEEIAKYTFLKATGVYGGANIKTQAAAVAEGVDIVVGTPGRINDLLLNGVIPPKQVKKVVIDEVDQMMKLGFRAELKNLLDLLPEKRQTMMFSATMTEEIEGLLTLDYSRLERIEDAATGTPLTNITQLAYEVPNFNTKMNLLDHLLSTDRDMTRVLVFAGTKRIADRINMLMEDKYGEEMAVIHANKSSNRRFRTVEEFESGDCRILIASDLLARGLDVTEVTHVVNFIMPEVATDYIHRIGRTGRADKKGISISFVSLKEQEYLDQVEEMMDMKVTIIPMPEEVEISTVLIPDEEHTPGMKIIQVRQPKVENKGAAFHEKLEKNKKVPIKVTREDKKKLKYGKNYQSGAGGRPKQ
jgi:ATP-dependent RNA helicase RhlE